jgi:hypothetical protein
MHGFGGSRGTSICEDFSNQSNKLKQPFSVNSMNINSDSHVCAEVGTEGKRIFTREEIIAFGGIPEPKALDVRTSARIGAQAKADQTQMERPMYAAQRRSTLGTTGMSPNKSVSLLSFSPERIICNASSLGVSLGNSRDEEIKSAKLILENELPRSVTMLQTSDDSTLTNENRPQCLIVRKASNLCEDLLDDDDLIGEHILDIPVTNKVQKKQRKKRSYDKNNLRRSTRVRVKKQYS